MTQKHKPSSSTQACALEIRAPRPPACSFTPDLLSLCYEHAARLRACAHHVPAPGPPHGRPSARCQCARLTASALLRALPCRPCRHQPNLAAHQALVSSSERGLKLSACSRVSAGARPRASTSGCSRRHPRLSWGRAWHGAGALICHYAFGWRSLPDTDGGSERPQRGSQTPPAREPRGPGWQAGGPLSRCRAVRTQRGAATAESAAGPAWADTNRRRTRQRGPGAWIHRRERRVTFGQKRGEEGLREDSAAKRYVTLGRLRLPARSCGLLTSPAATLRPGLVQGGRGRPPTLRIPRSFLRWLEGMGHTSS